MRKFFLLISAFILSLTAAVLAACDGGTSDNPPDEPKVPVLHKNSFSIVYEVNDDGVQYNLTWSALDAVKFDVKFGETQIETTETSFALKDFAADTVHSVTVTAIGEEGLQSQPVELKFKGTKVEAPKNVRLHNIERYGTVFGWDDCGESEGYRLVSFEQLDLQTETSKPVGTGKFTYSPRYFYKHMTIDDLRATFKGRGLSPLECLRVQNLPYPNSLTRIDYTEATDVLQLYLPSDFSEQSVNLYAGKLSNPTNICWGEGLDEYGNLTVKWDGAVADYTYNIMVKYPDGHSSGWPTAEKGVSEWHVGFDYTMNTGDYTVTVEPVYDEFNYVGKDDEAKSVTYTFLLPDDEAETLSFHLNATELKTPRNVRIEDGYVVCDKVENAAKYSFALRGGENNSISEYTSDNAVSLEVFFNRASWLDADGFFDLEVYAHNGDAVLGGFDNGIPQITVYKQSERVKISQAVHLKYAPAVQNVRIDYETNTVYWDGVDGATSYEVWLLNENGNGSGHTNINDTQYQYIYGNIADYDKVEIVAVCEYNVTIEDGKPLIIIPSKCVVPIEH